MQFMFSNRMYTAIKYLVQVILPAAATLYFTLAQTWEWDNAEQVVGTISAIALFLGVCLGISAHTYNRSDARFDGQMNLEMDPGGIKRYSMELNSPPEVLEHMDTVSFKVNRTPAHPASQE